MGKTFLQDGSRVGEEDAGFLFLERRQVEVGRLCYQFLLFLKPWRWILEALAFCEDWPLALFTFSDRIGITVEEGKSYRCIKNSP